MSGECRFKDFRLTIFFGRTYLNQHFSGEFHFKLKGKGIDLNEPEYQVRTNTLSNGKSSLKSIYFIKISIFIHF